MKIQTAQLHDPFELELGGSLFRPQIAYTTYGRLSKKKDNVILVCHALTANSLVHEWWSGLFGKGKVLNPEENYIICINNLGSPYGTSSPKSSDMNGDRYGMTFPRYTIRDAARLHERFLHYLDIDTVELIIGGSCGGNIAQEMGILMGERVNEIIMMCCSAMETPWVIGIHESQRIALKSDPSFSGNTPESGIHGLAGARGFALPFYRSHASFKVRQKEDDLDKVEDFKASSYIRYQGQKFVDRYDAQCYYMQLDSLDTHNVGRGRESVSKALSKISARTLCLGFNTDLLIPTVEQQFLANNISNAHYSEIETIFGHDAFLIETDQIQAEIDAWKNI